MPAPPTRQPHVRRRDYWRCRGLNPGPLACEASALPLSYIPIAIPIPSPWPSSSSLSSLPSLNTSYFHSIILSITMVTTIYVSAAAAAAAMRRRVRVEFSGVRQ